MLMVPNTFTMQQNKNEWEAIRGKTGSFLLFYQLIWQCILRYCPGVIPVYLLKIEIK